MRQMVHACSVLNICLSTPIHLLPLSLSPLSAYYTSCLRQGSLLDRAGEFEQADKAFCAALMLQEDQVGPRCLCL